MEWISTKDRLPSKSGKYIVAYQRCYGTKDIEGCDIDMDLFNVDRPEGKQWFLCKYRNVKYWMPLPQLPKE